MTVLRLKMIVLFVVYMNVNQRPDSPDFFKNLQYAFILAALAGDF